MADRGQGKLSREVKVGGDNRVQHSDAYNALLASYVNGDKFTVSQKRDARGLIAAEEAAMREAQLNPEVYKIKQGSAEPPGQLEENGAQKFARFLAITSSQRSIAPAAQTAPEPLVTVANSKGGGDVDNVITGFISAAVTATAALNTATGLVGSKISGQLAFQVPNTGTLQNAAGVAVGLNSDGHVDSATVHLNAAFDPIKTNTTTIIPIAAVNYTVPTSGQVFNAKNLGLAAGFVVKHEKTPVSLTALVTSDAGFNRDKIAFTERLSAPVAGKEHDLLGKNPFGLSVTPYVASTQTTGGAVSVGAGVLALHESGFFIDASANTSFGKNSDTTATVAVGYRPDYVAFKPPPVDKGNASVHENKQAMIEAAKAYKELADRPGKQNAFWIRFAGNLYPDLAIREAMDLVKVEFDKINQVQIVEALPDDIDPKIGDVDQGRGS